MFSYWIEFECLSNLINSNMLSLANSIFKDIKLYVCPNKIIIINEPHENIIFLRKLNVYSIHKIRANSLSIDQIENLALSHKYTVIFIM